MRALLEQVRAGTMSWDRFFSETAAEWDRLARHVYRRWKLPAGVSEDDVAQELKTNGYVAGCAWNGDRSKAASFPSYVIWMAIADTKKWIHTQRKALRRDGKAPSRVAMNFSMFEFEPDISQLPAAEALGEKAALVAQALERIDVCSQHILVALVGAQGDIEEAARDLWSDYDMRRWMQVDTYDETRAAVERVVTRAANQIQ